MDILITLLNLYWYVVIASVIVSWLPIPQDNPLIQVVNTLTEPVYEPIRKVLPPSRFGGLDLSPIVVMVGIGFLKGILRGTPF